MDFFLTQVEPLTTFVVSTLETLRVLDFFALVQLFTTTFVGLLFTIALLLCLGYYCFFSREIIRETKDKRAAAVVEKSPLTLKNRNASFEDLGLQILFEDLDEKIAADAMDRELLDEDIADQPEMLDEDGIHTSTSALRPPADDLLSSSDAELPLPRDMLAFLKSISVFGYFDEPVFLELFKSSETVQMKKDDYLFRAGDTDCSLYVIVKGHVRISLNQPAVSHMEPAPRTTRQARSNAAASADTQSPMLQRQFERRVRAQQRASKQRMRQRASKLLKQASVADDELCVAEMFAGDSVSSLFNVLSVLTHGEEFLRNVLGGSQVSAQCAADSTLVRIPTRAFVHLSDTYPRAAMHIIQVILTRFHRVTFTTLNRFLGLSDEFLIDTHGARNARAAAAAANAATQTQGVASSTSELASAASTGDVTTESESDSLSDDDGSGGVKGWLSANNMELMKTLTKLDERGVYDLFEDERVTKVKDDEHGDRNCLAVVGDMEVLYVPQGTVLTEEGERDAGMFVVLRGTLQTSVGGIASDNDDESATGAPSAPPSMSFADNVSRGEQTLFRARRGDFAGYLALVTHYPSLVKIVATEDCCLGYVSAESYARLITNERQGLALLRCIGRLTGDIISPLARQIDYALDWVHINSGQFLYKENDESAYLYVVLSGRLRSALEKKNGQLENAGEFGKGESVGEFSVFTDTPCESSVYAIRDSELMRMPKALLKVLALKIPTVAIQISRLTAHRSLQHLHRLRHPAPTVNMCTVALLPVTTDVPIDSFAADLQEAVSRIGPSTTLTKERVAGHLGKQAFSQMAHFRLSAWLHEQEESHRIVLYQCDPVNSSWTQRCIRQADIILLVGLADHPQPTPSSLERVLLRAKTPARKELVLLHVERGKRPVAQPSGTAVWLQERPWLHGSHHVRIGMTTREVLHRAEHTGPARAPSLDPAGLLCRRKSSLAAKSDADMTGVEPSASMSNFGVNSDLMRLARRLTGTAVGLVLGGGGARGLAHIGVIRALEEQGIPIDMIGGTSIGACVGALYARHTSLLTVQSIVHRFTSMMSSKWIQLIDLTYPITSLFTGRAFNRIVRKTVGEAHIEDLWIPYYCVSTNITRSRLETHRFGSAWRYVRASMTLAGYLPPLSDKGNLLVDGGYVNNLPADIMRTLGASKIIAVDVASEDDTSPVIYGDTLSGWRVLFARWNPFGEQTRFPTINDIQARLAYVGNVKLVEEVKAMDDCLYLRPPVAPYATLDWLKLNEIVETGYSYAKDRVALWHAKCLEEEALTREKAAVEPEYVRKWQDRRRRRLSI